MANTRLKRSLRVTLAGMGVNVLLGAGKLAAGIFGHSHALIADAVESLADIFSSLVVWRGVVLAAEPADEEHPYGHAKAESIAAAIVSTMLLVAAIGIISKSIESLAGERAQGPSKFTLVVLVAVIVVKEVMFRFVVKTANAIESSAVKADAWHHRSDAITSLAAFIGISVALIGKHGFEKADDVAAVFGAIVIGVNGWMLLRPSLNDLMDVAPKREVVEQIRSIAQTIHGVDAVEQCRARKSGNRYWVDMHIEVDPEMTVKRAHTIAHEVKDKVQAKLSSVRDVLVHVEPAGQNPKATKPATKHRQHL